MNRKVDRLSDISKQLERKRSELKKLKQKVKHTMTKIQNLEEEELRLSNIIVEYNV